MLHCKGREVSVSHVRKHRAGDGTSLAPERRGSVSRACVYASPHDVGGVLGVPTLLILVRRVFCTWCLSAVLITRGRVGGSEQGAVLSSKSVETMEALHRRRGTVEAGLFWISTKCRVVWRLLLFYISSLRGTHTLSFPTSTFHGIDTLFFL